MAVRFPTGDVRQVKLKFVEDYPDAVANSYTVILKRSSHIEISVEAPGVSLGPHTLNIDLKADVDFQLWVDFSTDKFAVGVGSEVIHTTDLNHPTVSQLVIESTTTVTATVCGKRG